MLKTACKSFLVVSHRDTNSFGSESQYISRIITLSDCIFHNAERSDKKNADCTYVQSAARLNAMRIILLDFGDLDVDLVTRSGALIDAVDDSLVVKDLAAWARERACHSLIASRKERIFMIEQAVVGIVGQYRRPCTRYARPPRSVIQRSWGRPRCRSSNRSRVCAEPPSVPKMMVSPGVSGCMAQAIRKSRMMSPSRAYKRSGEIVNAEACGVLSSSVMRIGGSILRIGAEEVGGVARNGQRLRIADRVEHHVQRIAADVAQSADTSGALLDEGAVRDAATTAAAGLDVIDLAQHAGLSTMRLDHLHVGVIAGLEADGQDLAALLLGAADFNGLVQSNGKAAFRAIRLRRAPKRRW